MDEWNDLRSFKKIYINPSNACNLIITHLMRASKTSVKRSKESTLWAAGSLCGTIHQAGFEHGTLWTNCVWTVLMPKPTQPPRLDIIIIFFWLAKCGWGWKGVGKTWLKELLLAAMKKHQIFKSIAYIELEQTCKEFKLACNHIVTNILTL